MLAYVTSSCSKPNEESPYAHRASSLQCPFPKIKLDSLLMKETKITRRKHLKETNSANGTLRKQTILLSEIRWETITEFIYKRNIQWAQKKLTYLKYNIRNEKFNVRAKR